MLHLQLTYISHPTYLHPTYISHPTYSQLLTHVGSGYWALRWRLPRPLDIVIDGLGTRSLSHLHFELITASAASIGPSGNTVVVRLAPRPDERNVPTLRVRTLVEPGNTFYSAMHGLNVTLFQITDSQATLKFTF